MIKLILKFQDTVLEEYIFEKFPVTVGRRDDNDIVIDNMAVSGHHTLIDRDEADPRYFVVADRDSLNGTFLNSRRVDRERIFHGDTFIVGKHVIDFQDLRPESERPPRPEPHEAGDKEYRETVAMNSEQQAAVEAAREGGPLPEKPKRVELYGSITIISGGVPQIIDLDKRLTVLGRSDEADIKCSGLLVGKKAALISKRPNGYFLAYAEGMKKPEVNGEAVSTQVQLRDGDEIAIGGNLMTFNLQEEVID